MVGALAATLSIFSPAHLKAAPLTTVQGWSIVPGEEYCTMVTDYDGPGHLQFSVSVFARNPHVLVVFVDETWKSVVEGNAYTTRMVLDDKDTWSGTSAGMTTTDGDKGIAQKIEGFEFLVDLSRVQTHKVGSLGASAMIQVL